MNRFRFAVLVAVLIALSGLSGCRTVNGYWREETANRLAVPAGMFKRQISADPFMITVFERVHKAGDVATIYIEGDGVAWMTRTMPSLNPTPDYPVALHLATRDLSPNVIYVARPCQFSSLIAENTPCPQTYWTDGRFSATAMDSMNTVLDKLKSTHRLSGFNLVGYSGGGAVATLLAARRKDVLSLRTVAGNLDHVVLNANHDVSPMTQSLNPRDVAKDVASVPQHHFVGAWDDVVNTSVYDSFRRAMGDSHCTRMSVVDEVDHEKGWVNRWPSLLQQPVDCDLTP